MLNQSKKIGERTRTVAKLYLCYQKYPGVEYITGCLAEIKRI
jgi:hypothetical protein